MRTWGLACLYLASAAGPALSQASQNYSYDVHGRLTTTEQSSASDARFSNYALDSADNRINRTVGPSFAQVWEAEALPHVVGFAEGDGWAGNTSTASSYLTYGPYVNTVPVGSRVAIWRIQIDALAPPDAGPVIGLDVYDATTSEVIAGRALRREEWQSPGVYQTFELPFAMDPSRAGHTMEFRTVFIPYAHVRIDKVGYR